jgi:polyhydroxyalkanoate synthesis regulator phasin
MDNWCVFCGQPIEDGKLTCDQCEGIVQDLTPEQRKALEKYAQDEEARAKLKEAIRNIKEAVKPICDAVLCAIEAICDALGGADDGQQG